MTDNQNNFYGDASNIQIQQNTEHSSQSQVISNTLDYNKILNGIQQLKNEIDTLGLDDKQQRELSDLLESVNKAVSEKESPSKIEQGLNLLKDFFMRTATTLAANGAVQLITSLLSSI